MFLTLSLAVVGCGGGESSAPAPVTTPSTPAVPGDAPGAPGAPSAAPGAAAPAEKPAEKK
jgi:hypothetical protein